MTTSESPPIACTLAPGDLAERFAWIADLARSALQRHERRDLVLDLTYAPEASARVREMMRREQGCCAFLAFDLREAAGEVRLTIIAPEDARSVADMLFEKFVAAGAPQRACRCC